MERGIWGRAAGGDSIPLSGLRGVILKLSKVTLGDFDQGTATLQHRVAVALVSPTLVVFGSMEHRVLVFACIRV